MQYAKTIGKIKRNKELYTKRQQITKQKKN